MKDQLLKAALHYRKMGFSVIPVKQDKTPFIKWEKYQTQKADEKEIDNWWSKWPDANIGIVTGRVSSIDVVDVDSQAGHDALNEFLSDTLQTPICKTPSGGWHYYFAHKAGLVNATRLITDCDVRTTGGYIVAPPSVNGSGQSWAWMGDFHIARTELVPMPDMLFDILQAGAGDKSELSSEHIRMESSSRTGHNISNITNVTKHNKRNITFSEPGRDDSLFHISTCLVKGGMSVDNVEKCLDFYASHCNPVFPEKERKIKIKSALQRLEKRSENLTSQIREFINITWDNFNVTDCLQNITNITLQDRAKVATILWRIAKNEKIIEKVPGRTGIYRRVESDLKSEDWQDACTDTVNLWLPFRLNEMISIMPGSVILFAGSQDAGKSAVMMNLARENMRDWNVHYFSSELNSGAFKARVGKFPDISTDQWNIEFYQKSSNFHDVLRTKKNDLNLIDYLEIHDNFFKVSEYLAKLHEKIGDGICVVALQKDPGSLYGRGGSFTQEKPILSVSLDHGKATISKFKGEYEGESPRGKEYRFKIVDGCQIIHVQGWHTPVKI